MGSMTKSVIGVILLVIALILIFIIAEGIRGEASRYDEQAFRITTTLGFIVGAIGLVFLLAGLITQSRRPVMGESAPAPIRGLSFYRRLRRNGILGFLLILFGTLVVSILTAGPPGRPSPVGQGLAMIMLILLLGSIVVTIYSIIKLRKLKRGGGTQNN